MTKFITSILLILLSTTSNATQDEAILVADENIVGVELIKFPNDQRIFPKRSDFTILHSIIMSSAGGERAVTLTIKNSAHGTRTFNQEQILALFADGSRQFPLSFERKFEAQSVQSLLVSFGTNQYPIIKVMTRK